MLISATAALWFLPFVLPICVYICYTDMKGMRIPNHAVMALFAVFAVLGVIALPFDAYLWRYMHLVVVLVAGIALNAGGAVGAAFVAHRLAKLSPLRRLAPEWKSWDSGARFPMGLALGGSLAIYLVMGVYFGR